MEHQITFADLGLWSGKTSPEPSPATAEKISGRSSKKLSGSQNRTLPTFHYLQRGSGRWQTPTMEMGGLLPTEFLTQSFGEYPSAVVESTLSQILEDDPPPGYYLSTKACAGILTRSRRRGKPLPPELEEALVRQSASGSVEDVRGGKGALITEEASGTLSCHNDQTIFCLNDQGGQIMGISENVSGTLRAEEHGHQPIILDRPPQLFENHGQDSRLRGPLEVAPTISQKFGTGGNNTPLVMSFKGGAGAKAGGIGLQEEESPTLTAAGSGTNRVPLVYTQQKFGHYKAGEVAHTLTANNGTRHTGESLIVETMTPWDVQSGRIYGTDGVAPTLSSNGGKAGLNRQGFLTQACVRRLTPLECERLQGYPDGWTILPVIEDMSDTGYEFWKAVLLEKAAREGKARISEDGIWEIWSFIPSENEDEEGHWENTHKLYKHKTKKQMVAWYNRSFCENTDSARYKAMGNSIDLPSWRWVLKRISAMYEREATMASLFDGVGGFPLLWEQINGKGGCLWASEIELFPIAVTRYRFGGEA